MVTVSAVVDPMIITLEDSTTADEFQKKYVSHVPLPILPSFNAILRAEQLKESYLSRLVCNYLYEHKMCRSLVEFDEEIKHLEVTFSAVFSLRGKDFTRADMRLEKNYELYLNYSQMEKHIITAKCISNFT